MISFLSWMLFGLLVGALAKFIMPGKDPGGLLATMLLGLIGAVAGGLIGSTLGLYGPNDSTGLIMAVIGALCTLLLYRLVRRSA